MSRSIIQRITKVNTIVEITKPNILGELLVFDFFNKPFVRLSKKL